MLHALGGFETLNHHTALVDEEFGKIPLDIGFLLVVRIGLGEHLVEDGRQFVCLIPSCKSLLLFQKFEQWVGIVAIDLDFLESGKFCAVGELAETMNGLVGAGCLLAELVAGEIEDLETLGMVSLEGFQCLVLGGEPTFGRCVDYQKHLVGILAQGNFLSFPVFY